MTHTPSHTQSSSGDTIRIPPPSIVVLTSLASIGGTTETIVTLNVDLLTNRETRVEFKETSDDGLTTAALTMASWDGTKRSWVREGRVILSARELQSLADDLNLESKGRWSRTGQLAVVFPSIVAKKVLGLTRMPLRFLWTSIVVWDGDETRVLDSNVAFSPLNP